MSFAWKILVPLSIFNILVAAIWYECVFRPSVPRYLLGWGITAPLVLFAVWITLFLNQVGRMKSERKARPEPVRVGRGDFRAV